MHIVHVYKDYPPVVGGIEKTVQALAEQQAAAGLSVSVLVTNPGPSTVRTLERGVQVIRAARIGTLASAPLSLALFRELARLPATITHVHVPYPVGEAAWLLAGHPPLVVTYHSDIVRQRVLGRLWSPGLRLLLRRAACVIATNAPYVELSPFLRGVRDKVKVIPIGIRPEPFESADRAEALRRFGEGPTVVFVGRLRYYKGVGVLLTALSRLPGVRLLAVGTGPMEGRLRAQAAALGLTDRVVWLGEVTDADLPLVLAAGDVFALPGVARSEAFGIAQLEAMATGLPVVTTELGTGTSWVTQDGLTGRVVRPGDADALAGALRELLADPALRRRLGQAGRARVREHFTEATMAAAVRRVYEEVLAD